MFYQGQDQDDTNSITPTSLDIERLQDMSIGDTVEHELGNWKVLRYKNDFTIIFDNHTKYSILEFKNVNLLIKFLQEH